MIQKRRIYLHLLTVLLAAFSPAVVRASTIFGNLGAEGTFNTTSFYALETCCVVHAMPFTPSITTKFADSSLALGKVGTGDSPLGGSGRTTRKRGTR
jgi:hypothetical protein